MHVALIFCEERLLHEHVMLNRLAIGLIAEGLRVTRIVPELMEWEHVLLGEKRIALTPRHEVEMKVLPWMRKPRAAQLALDMEKSPPDAIYAVGEGSWEVGLDLAIALDKPLLINVWNPKLARHVPKGRQADHIAAYVTPTNALNHLLSRSVDPGLVCTVPMGIALPSKPRTILSEPQNSISMVIVGSGRDLPAYRNLLGGISLVEKDFPHLRIFLELRDSNHHEIWRYARKLKLLDRISMLTEASPHRRLLTKCDVMLVPERYGELYSIMLEAMAHGMVIVAFQDAMLEMLKPNENAFLIEHDGPDQWAQQIRRIIKDPDAARQMGGKARDFVVRHHSTNAQVDALITLLERVIKGGAYSFAQAADSAPALK